MPYRRPARRARRPARRPARSGMGRKRMVRSIRQPVQYFKRSLYLSGAITATSTAETFGAIAFSLAQLPNSTEFTSFYDQYRINGVKATFIPRGTSSDVGTSTTAGQSMGFFTALDYDDATPPTAISDLCQYQNMKMTRTTQQHTRYLKPKPLMLVQQAGGGTSPAVSNQWIDCGANIVNHHGIKYAIQQLPAGSQSFDIKYDFYLAFKNVR